MGDRGRTQHPLNDVEQRSPFLWCEAGGGVPCVLRELGHGFGLHLIGNKGIIAIRADRQPFAYWVPGNPLGPTRESRPWIPFTTAGPGKPEGNLPTVQAVHNHVIPAKDLVRAIHEDRQPLCNLAEGGMTVEMICAVFESHRQNGAAVPIPLKERGNALAKL